jgi:OPT family oligopeptide transporter
VSSSAAGAALCTEVIAAQKLYYPNQPGQAVSIFLIFSSQLLGYGFAGLMRSTLVYPKAMLYPGALPISTLFQTLHRDKNETKLRLKFFYIVAAAIFVWEWLPEYIMPILVGVNVFCLAKRNSLVFTNVFGGAGGNEGLGIFGICFDWQYITSGCLYLPPLTILTGFTGYCLCIFIFVGLYYGNIHRAQSFPFLSQLLFTDQSNSTAFDLYNQSLILNENSEFDPAKLADVGLPWFTTTYASSLLTTNLATTATITYMFLYHVEDLAIIYKAMSVGFFRSLLKPSTWHWKFWDGKQQKPDKDDPTLDPHYRLMLEYDEVPGWWYAAVMIGSFTVGLICIYEAKSTLPWYAYIVSILLSFVFTLFMGIQTARFGMYVGQQNLIQMVGAFINPGKPLANMYFTLFGSNSVTQSLGLLSDLKLGQYMKLAPKCTFTMQIIGTVVGAILNFTIMETVTDARRDILLSIEGTNVWSGQVIQSYNSQVSYHRPHHYLFYFTN